MRYVCTCAMVSTVSRVPQGGRASQEKEGPSSPRLYTTLLVLPGVFPLTAHGERRPDVVATEQAQLLSTGEAARRLGISMSLLRRWEQEGKIPPAHRLAGSDRRVYSLQDIEAIRATRATAQPRREVVTN